MKEEEEKEKEFWEGEYRSEDDGSFKTLADRSYRDTIDFFSISDSGLGLDYACGSGSFSDFIHGPTMVGLDISHRLLCSTSSIVPVQGSGECLPFKDGLFDFVLCAAALHHIPDLQRGIHEIARVLKPGGNVFVLELNVNHPQRKLVAAAESRWRHRFSGTHFSPSETLIPEARLVNLLTQSGFVIEKHKYYTPHYRCPSSLGKFQALLSACFSYGPLKKFVESYLLISAKKHSELSGKQE